MAAQTPDCSINPLSIPQIHQKDQQKRIVGNLYPFELKEAHYANTIFYLTVDATELKSQRKREPQTKSSMPSQVWKLAHQNSTPPSPSLKSPSLVSGLPLFYLGSDLDSPVITQVNIIFKKVLEPLQDMFMPLSVLMIQEVNELYMVVNRPKNRHQKAILFYGFLIDDTSNPMGIPDLDHDEVESSYALDTHKEAKLIKLL